MSDAQKQEDKKKQTQGEDIMSRVKVTYFKSLNIQNTGRVLDMIGHDIPHLVHSAANHMATDEEYACFTAPDGKVIALDKHSQFVMV